MSTSTWDFAEYCVEYCVGSWIGNRWNYKQGCGHVVWEFLRSAFSRMGETKETIQPKRQEEQARVTGGEKVGESKVESSN